MLIAVKAVHQMLLFAIVVLLIERMMLFAVETVQHVVFMRELSFLSEEWCCLQLKLCSGWFFMQELSFLFNEWCCLQLNLCSKCFLCKSCPYWMNGVICSWSCAASISYARVVFLIKRMVVFAVEAVQQVVFMQELSFLFKEWCYLLLELCSKCFYAGVVLLY